MQAHHPDWWKTEPIRLIQTNIPIRTLESYSPQQILDQVLDYNGTAWLLNCGGIYANYPTRLAHQPLNPYMTAGTDFFGEAVRLARQKGVRIFARFDFSRVTPELITQHPEWGFIRANGEQLAYNGLFQTCINGPYYREHALETLREALTWYEIDGFFLNWFGNQKRNWYDGSENGCCHCLYCQERWAETQDTPLPDDPFDPEYDKWMVECYREVTLAMHAVKDETRPEAVYFMHHGSPVWDAMDGMTVEARDDYENTTEWWPYNASLWINTERSNHPDRLILDVVVDFINFRYRYAEHRAGQIATRIYQTMANGCPPSYYLIGALDRVNHGAKESIRAPYALHTSYAEAYLGQHSNARIALAQDDENDIAFKGIFQLLAENHLPVKVLKQAETLCPESVDLLISTRADFPGMKGYVEGGGTALMIGAHAPDWQEVPALVKHWSAKETQSAYWKTNDSFQHLKESELIPLIGEYLEYDQESNLTLCLPSLYAPPELVAIDWQESTKPGVLTLPVGAGTLCFVPWEAAATYFKHGSASIGNLFNDLIDDLIPQRQIMTDANGFVEITWMKQPSTGRQMLHLINLSTFHTASHSQPVPMGPITLKLKGSFDQAEAIVAGKHLSIKVKEGFSTIQLPSLSAYEMIILDPGER